MRLDSLLEAARLALEQLRDNKFRSGLTILGVVVGVATVMAMSAVITGIRTTVLEEIEHAGPRNFMVARYNIDDMTIVGSGAPSWLSNPPLTLEHARRIEDLDAIATTIVGFDINRAVSVPGRQLDNVPIIARDAAWTQFVGGTIAAGTNFLPADVRASRPVVVLSQNLADELFGILDPIGRQVRIDGRPFQVVGIFEPAPNIFAAIQRNYAIVPHTSAMKHFGVQGTMMFILVVPRADVPQDRAIDQVITTLRVARGLRPTDENNFEIIRQEEMADTFNRLTFVFFVVMVALSSIGLLVGGVGVIGIMMIAVTERIREIGIRMAVGATRGDILWQFLIEAATLTVVGGALGMLLGGAAAWIVQAASPIPAAVPIWAVAAALAMAAVAGILFGLWPAWRAARLDPVVALRYE